MGILARFLQRPHDLSVGVIWSLYIKDAGIIFKYVYCSPSLRCIQTCHNILKNLDALELQIRVELGTVGELKDLTNRCFT